MKRVHKSLPTRSHFLRRLGRNTLLMGGFIAFSLAWGAAGYHFLVGLDWLDATHNAAMILTGMGPVAPMQSRSAKVFGIVYALYSGVAFLTAVAVLLAPVVARFLHKFHLDLYGEDEHQG